MRKQISVKEGIFSSESNLKSKQRLKLMNDILYLVRRLTKLARRVKAISENVDEDFSGELQEIREEIEKLENELG